MFSVSIYFTFCGFRIYWCINLLLHSLSLWFSSLYLFFFTLSAICQVIIVLLTLAVFTHEANTLKQSRQDIVSRCPFSLLIIPSFGLGEGAAWVHCSFQDSGHMTSTHLQWIYCYSHMDREFVVVCWQVSLHNVWAVGHFCREKFKPAAHVWTIQQMELEPGLFRHIFPAKSTNCI